MKINFNGQSSIINAWRKKNLPIWFVTLNNQFFIEHDINEDSDGIHGFLCSEQYVIALANWLKAKGYNASYWCIDYHLRPDIKEPYAFGIDIVDDCPCFVELKLRS